MASSHPVDFVLQLAVTPSVFGSWNSTLTARFLFFPSSRIAALRDKYANMNGENPRGLRHSQLSYGAVSWLPLEQKPIPTLELIVCKPAFKPSRFDPPLCKEYLLKVCVICVHVN
ncbi:Uncharacterized protein Fot_06512 [Forsythia ovata]|uniref:Uncharacterized protein n=1 Tax=Forsythia ovata TaxID=205694 RepID=A0ABD1WW25_9LAMI